jgi:hypothetical protein
MRLHSIITQKIAFSIFTVVKISCLPQTMPNSFRIPVKSLFMLYNLWNINSMIENQTQDVALEGLALLLSTWGSPGSDLDLAAGYS